MKLKRVGFFFNLFLLILIGLNSSLSAMIQPSEEEEKEIKESSGTLHPSLRRYPQKPETKADSPSTSKAIQKKVNSQDKKPLKRTPKIIFEAFERLEPFGAVRYKEVFKPGSLKGQSVSERFKNIDGPIYQKNKPLGQKFAEFFARKESFQTSTKSGHLLRSQNIPPPKDRKRNIQQGDTFDPKMAMMELREIQSQFNTEKFTKMKMKEGRQSPLITAILERAKIEIIRDLNLGFYPPQQQIMVLRSIENFTPVELSLRFSPLVSLSYLQRLNLQNLRVLDLRGCEIIDDDFLVYGEKQLYQLQELNLSRIKSLKRIAKGEKKGFLQPLIFKPLEFLYLNCLSLSECENLEEIHLKAPSLKYLRANRCGKMKRFDLGDHLFQALECLSLNECKHLGEIYLVAPNLKQLSANQCNKLKVLNIKAPSLTFFSILGATELSEKTLDQFLLNLAKLSYLNYENFKGEEKKKALRIRKACPHLPLWYIWRELITKKDHSYQEKIDLDSFEPNAEDYKLLAKSVEKKPIIIRLDLGQGEARAEGTQVLPSLTNLRSLNISWNNLGVEGASALALMLDINSAYINGFIEGEGTQTLSSLTNLTSLDVSWNNLGAEGTNTLILMTNLTSLNMSYNFIEDEGAKVLRALTNLTELNLSGNKIGLEGAQALAALIKLKILNLEWNNIGAKGAQELRTLTNLVLLDLGGNNIGDKGIHGLTNLTNLGILGLGGNNIGAEGAQALTTLTNLVQLDLRNNKIMPKEVQPLMTLTKLEELNLSGNPPERNLKLEMEYKEFYDIVHENCDIIFEMCDTCYKWKNIIIYVD